MQRHVVVGVAHRRAQALELQRREALARHRLRRALEDRSAHRLRADSDFRQRRCAHGISSRRVAWRCASVRVPRTGRCGSAKPWLKPARVTSDELEAGAGERRQQARRGGTAASSVAPATSPAAIAATSTSGSERCRRSAARVRRGRARRARRGEPCRRAAADTRARRARARSRARRTATSSDIVAVPCSGDGQRGTRRRLRRARWRRSAARAAARAMPECPSRPAACAPGSRRTASASSSASHCRRRRRRPPRRGPPGTSSAAVHASRVIHDVRGLRKTLSARSGRPSSSDTQKRPRPTSASPASSSARSAGPLGARERR